MNRLLHLKNLKGVRHWKSASSCASSPSGTVALPAAAEVGVEVVSSSVSLSVLVLAEVSLQSLDGDQGSESSMAMPLLVVSSGPQ